MINVNSVVLLGVPGSGKGTISEFLVKEYDFNHISTGDLFRKTIDSGNELGKQLHHAVSTGALVKDELTNAVMKDEIDKLIKLNKPFILDGYPRSLKQAEFLKSICHVDLILLINIPKEIAIKRVAGRRLCPKCGAIYNIYFKPSKVVDICDYDGVTLIQRKDDNEQTMKTRFDVYETATKPLIDFYKNQNGFHIIDGNKDLNDIKKELRGLIK
ncbi:MAG: nucleoside monophosphate kinase [Mycoplasmataceae bacterium]|jgi:adenylate kinase|nr:nucleoside monophosphate kinase [Mycoplasmataceae bacterium]